MWFGAFTEFAPLIWAGCGVGAKISPMSRPDIDEERIVLLEQVLRAETSGLQQIVESKRTIRVTRDTIEATEAAIRGVEDTLRSFSLVSGVRRIPGPRTPAERGHD